MDELFDKTFGDAWQGSVAACVTKVKSRIHQLMIESHSRLQVHVLEGVLLALRHAQSPPGCLTPFAGDRTNRDVHSDQRHVKIRS